MIRFEDFLKMTNSKILSIFIDFKEVLKCKVYNKIGDDAYIEFRVKSRAYVKSFEEIKAMYKDYLVLDFEALGENLIRVHLYEA